MIADAIGSVLLYLVISIGLGWPIAARLSCPAPEKVLATVSLSLLGVFLFAWAVYVFSLPVFILWVLPVAAIVGIFTGWHTLAETWGARDVRELIIAQVIVTSWCVGWLALVITYSGGGWVGDWFGHWQRAMFFLEQGPRDILFNGFDPLTSRPPLVNIVVGAFMALTQKDFAHYQFAMTCFGSLAFLPAALLACRFGGQRSTALLAMLLMVNPMFVQNTTFAWTKLPAAFFTLAAIYYFLRREGDFPLAGILCAMMIGAALLAHYSAGPYAVVLVMAWVVRGWTRRRNPAWWRETAFAAAAGLAVLATWFAWSLSEYGVTGTVLTNTSVTAKAPTMSEQWISIGLNIRDTLVPHFMRNVDYQFIAQTSPWGWWRDWFFQLYQVNLLFAFGSIAWLVVIVALIKYRRVVTLKVHIATASVIVAVAALGIAVHSGRDTWGLAHICLQPLVLAGLALIAARWDSLGETWRRLAVAGAAVDLMLGIVLQFGAQSFLFDQWLAPLRSFAETRASYSTLAGINLNAKAHFKLTFLGDNFAAHQLMILLLLAALLSLALFRTGPRVPAER